jgi:glycosyltransferase involved in cell wall biosynthesis
VATSRIARQAAERGEEVHVIYLSKRVEPGSRGREERDGVAYHPVGLLPDDADCAWALTETCADLAATHGATLLHGIYATRAGYAAVLAARRLSLPSVVSIRGNDLDRGLYRARDLSFLRFALEHATVVTAVSAEGSRDAAAIFDRDVVHITNSVDGSAFRPETRDNSLAASLGLSPGEPVIGFSGELREKKGMRYLLPAFAALSEKRPIHLLLIGGVRNDASDAFEVFRATAPESARRVHVIDYDRKPERLRRLIALCDLMVFPSLYEGTPNAVLEAMACARPVLATAVGGHLDIIEHGRTGALLPLSDLGQLPHAIDEYLGLPADELSSIGAAARDAVLRNHGYEYESSAWAEVYARARSV